MEKKQIELQQNLQKTNYIKPSSFYQKINVPANQTTHTFTASNTSSLFNIPAGIVNFSKIELKYTLDQVAAVALRDICLSTDYFPWLLNLNLYSSQNNIQLCDFQNIDKYSRLVSPLYLDYKKRSNTCGWFYKSQRTTTAAVANVYINDPLISSNDAAGVSIDVLDPGIEKNFVGVSYSGGNGAVLPTRKFVIRLGDLLPDSIFNYNKDIACENLMLKLTWNPRGKILTNCNVAPATDAAEHGVNFTISDLSLNIFSQSNPDIIKTLEEKNDLGEELIVPEIQVSPYNFEAGLSQTTNIKVISGFANTHLYKTYCGVFRGDALNNQMRSTNFNLERWTNCDININNKIIKSINAIDGEDYEEAQRLFGDFGSLFGLNMLRLSGVVINLFDSDRIDTLNEYNNNELKGIPFGGGARDLSIQHKFTTTNTAGHEHYVFLIILRSIYIKNSKFSMTPI